MASKLSQLQPKVAQASQYVVRHGGSYYKQLLEKNEQYIQDPPTIEKCQLLAKQLFYTRLASIPNRYDVFWKEAGQFKNLLKNRELELNVENAGLAALFGVECFAWYCGGEIIGRGFTFTGYYV
ncbi:Mitochondrial ATP synthase subunit G protein [Quillaja saponaria]|uniref:Mitochondrial ATP synthase subunit G protein n=1 Tax=Quillaja saponaria TaxID=32244 RepID=A0AAD7PPJ0_QUISA|nr:Mitochondrial ATP synthase subunit G protein [Quillaja saponaria]